MAKGSDPEPLTSLSASAIKKLKYPNECELRVWLRENSDVEPLPLSGHALYLIGKGIEHEASVLDRLAELHGACVDIGGLDNDNALADTAAAIGTGGQMIYQGMLRAETEVDGETVEIIGYPDFLIPVGGGWEISDAKLPKTVFAGTEKEPFKPKAKQEHVFFQLRLYGWLFEQNYPGVPFTLCVYTGSNEREVIEYDGGASPLAELEAVMQIRRLNEEPEVIVGLTKCDKCEYYDHCWPRAKETKALGYVTDIDTKLASSLMADGVTTYPEILDRYDAESLTELKSPSKRNPDRPENQGPARKVIENVQALEADTTLRRRGPDGKEVELDPAVSRDPSYVMFDVENTPAGGDAEIFVYLWGLQVCGDDAGEFIPVFADFDDGADERCWREFLAVCMQLIADNPGIKFVHWSPHDATMIKTYMKRHDDGAGDGATVLESLLNLEPAATAALAMPIPGSSLKRVEKLVGFERTTDVAKGDDSIVAFEEAQETDDPKLRAEIVADLCAYNREDLEATWFVQRWIVDTCSDN